MPREGARKQRAEAANGFFVTDFSSRAAEDKLFLGKSPRNSLRPWGPLFLPLWNDPQRGLVKGIYKVVPSPHPQSAPSRINGIL